MVLFEQATKELGYHPYPAPAATLSQQYTNPDGVSRAGCQYCGYCMLYGCMVAAKAQPDEYPDARPAAIEELRRPSRVLGAADRAS